jgi:hypothetical protein
MGVDKNSTQVICTPNIIPSKDGKLILSISGCDGLGSVELDQAVTENHESFLLSRAGNIINLQPDSGVLELYFNCEKMRRITRWGGRHGVRRSGAM